MLGHKNFWNQSNVKRIKDLASNKELYQHISEKAHLTITQKFDVKLMMNDLFQLYKNVNK